MFSMRKLNWKKIIIRTCWSLLGVGVVVIFGAAMANKSKQPCQGIRVTIESVASDQLFIDEKEISGPFILCHCAPWSYYWSGIHGSPMPRSISIITE
jgi:hypothetical protein